MLGKNLTLGFAGLARVAEYETVLTLPGDLAVFEDAGGRARPPSVEVPTAYLDPCFNRFFTYDAMASLLEEISPPPAGASPRSARRSSGRQALVGSSSPTPTIPTTAGR